MGEWMEFFKYIAIAITLFYIAWWLHTSDKRKAKKQLDAKIQAANERKNKLGIAPEDIKFTLYGNLESNYCIINKKNELFVVGGNSGQCIAIKYDDILDIKIDMHTVEKNTRRVVAFSPTYDKSIHVTRVDFKLITSENTYTVYMTPNTLSPSGNYLGNTQHLIDFSERFKLIIEREIKKYELYYK